MHKIKELEIKDFRIWDHLLLEEFDKRGLCLIQGPNGIGKCVDKETYILHNSTLKKISDIDSWEFNGFSEKKEKISSICGKQDITSHIYNTVTFNTIKIRVQEGLEIEGTPEHKILVIDSSANIVFKRLDEIDIGDFVCIDRNQQVFPIENPKICYKKGDVSKYSRGIEYVTQKTMNEDLAKILGYYIADGNYQDKKDIVTITTGKQQLLTDLLYSANRLKIPVKYRYVEYKHCFSINLGGVWFARFLKYLLDNNTSTARYKTVPNIILQSTKEVQIAFLRALIDSDGSFSSKLEYSTSSAKLANVVQLMLLNLGIVSRKSYKEKVHIGDKIYNHRYYRLTIRDIDRYFEIIGSIRFNNNNKTRNTNVDIIPFVNIYIKEEINRIKKLLKVTKIGLYRTNNESKRFIDTSLIISKAKNITYRKLSNFWKHLKYHDVFKYFDKNFKENIENILKYNFYFSRVTSTDKKEGTKKVYDVTLPKTSCFFSNGFISHNSSIRMALEYLLTDRLIDASISVNDLPKRPNDSFYLRCIIECEDGRELEIIKSRGEKYGNTSTILLDGNDISSTTRRETQQQIFNILNINKNSLPYSSIFTQSSPSFVDTPDADRKKILYDFLDLYKYNDYCEILKTQYINTAIEEISIRKQKVENILDNLLDVDDEIEEYKLKKREFESNKLRKVKELEEDKKNIKEKDLSYIDKKIKSLKTKIKEVPKTNEIEDEIEELKEKLTEAKKEKSIVLREMDIISDNICPILSINCKQLEDKKEEIEKNNIPKLNKLDKSIKKRQAQLSELLKELNRISDIIYENEEIKEEIEDLKHQKQIQEEKNKNVRNSITNLEKRIQEIKNEKNPYASIIRKLNKNKTSLIERKTENENRIEKLNDDLKYYKFWLKGFGREGIPNLRIEHILGVIEDNVNKYLSMLSGNMSVKIESQTTLKDGSNRERIGYKVKTPTGEVEYNVFSGGEKQRLKLATILAFSNIMQKFNILLLDEVLDLSLDDFGSKDIMKLLKKESNKLGSVFVMSHKTEIKDEFDNVIEIDKL